MNIEQAAPAQVAVLSNGHCRKAEAIAVRVAALGVDYRIVDVDRIGENAQAFGALFADGLLHAPALVVTGKAWRNPSLEDIEKRLARAGYVKPRAIHYPNQQRVVWHMSPQDAFASYTVRSNGTLVFGHIETPAALRGTGLGARLAKELFDWIEASDLRAKVTCSFLRRVAATRSEWAADYL